MPTIDRTAAELHTMAKAIDKAAADAAAAAAKAGDVAARAAASGFVGMHRVQSITQQAIDPMRTASNGCREAAGPVTKAPKESSPQQTIDVLSASIARTETVFTALSGAIHAIAEAQRLAATVLQGGQPGPILAMLGEVKKGLVQMAQHATNIKQTMQAAIAEAKQTGRLEQPGN